MRNISTTGCLIACEESELPRGALLRLRIKGLTAIDCEMVWQHRGHAGVRFRASLHPALIEHLAFRGIEQDFRAPAADPIARVETSPRRAAAGLCGRLVKRGPAEPENSEPGYASTG